MFSHYFNDYEVRPEFRKEFISLWPGWLGLENLHKLDEVTEGEWDRFNVLLTLILEQYEVFVADLQKESLRRVLHAKELVQTYSESQGKTATMFTKLVIPKLGCALTEEWDFTYIFWHRDKASVTAIAPLIAQAQLYHFSENT